MRPVWLVLALLALISSTECQIDSEDNCAGSGATVRQLLLYDLKNADADNLQALQALFQQRMEECKDVLYPGSSYGGPSITIKQQVYGFPASRPMPASATIVDWAGWLDFSSIQGLRTCLKINNRTGTLRAMRAFAQPNGRIDLIITKNSTPGSKNEPCPFPGSYAPATIRFIFAYILRPDADIKQSCTKGNALMRRMLTAAGYDVRHGTSCSLLSDAEARKYGINLNSGFGGYVDYATLRDMTRFLASNNKSIRADRKQLRSMGLYIARAAVALPWSGR